MPDCVFCQVVAGELPSTKEYEDNEVLGFRSVVPQADTHVVFIPKKHIANLSEASDSEVLGKILIALRDTAKKLNIMDYKVINNNGQYQHVPHIHFHLLGGTLTPLSGVKGGII